MQPSRPQREFNKSSGLVRWGARAIVAAVITAPLALGGYVANQFLDEPLFKIDFAALLQREPTRDEQIAQQAEDAFLLGVGFLSSKVYSFPVPDRLKGKHDLSEPAYFSYNMARLELCEHWKESRSCRSGLELDVHVRNKIEDSACALAKAQGDFFFSRQYCRPRVMV